MARTTLKNVAEAVGLNLSTVSRVLNRPESARVSDETRRRVLDTASALGYRVNATAQALARGRIGSIGILIPDYLDPVYMRYVEELSRLFEREGSLLIPMTTHYRPEIERRALHILSGGRADLVIALRHDPQSATDYDDVRHAGLPIIFRMPDDEAGDIAFDTVRVDVSAGFGALASHFAAQGCRRPALVGGFAARELATGVLTSSSIRSFLAGCRRHGITPGPEMAVPCDTDAESARDALLAACSDDPRRYDAIIVQANRFLPGICSALRQLGLQVPRDVALGVISDSPYCRVTELPLAVWAQPVDPICQALFTLARQRLEQASRPYRHLSFRSRLVVRNSATYAVTVKAP